MKAILEFDLPEEEENFRIYNKALDMSYDIDDYRNFLRNHLKYQCDKMSDDYIKAFTFARDKFFYCFGDIE